MASKRAQVLQAVAALVVAAIPAGDVKRNQEKPTRIAPGGTVILRDGDPGAPEWTLSPLSYTYSHRIPLEIAAFEAANKTPDEILDGLLGLVGAAVRADRTLGGLCEWVEVEAATLDDLETAGSAAGRWADTAIIAVYSTPDPLN